MAQLAALPFGDVAPGCWAEDVQREEDTQLPVFLQQLPGDIYPRFWENFVMKGVTDLKSVAQLGEERLRDIIPVAGPRSRLLWELNKDWNCGKCGFINYGRYLNTQCYRCNSPRTVTAIKPHEITSSDTISQMLQEREQARKAQNFGKADEIRDHLRKQGITIDDDSKIWRASDGRWGRWGTPTNAPLTEAVGGYCIKLKGLPFRVRYEDIRNFFKLANIEIMQYSVVLEKNADGRPSGVGFVKVATHQDQQLACSQLNLRNIPGYDRYAWVVESNEAEYQAAKNSCWVTSAAASVSNVDGDDHPISILLKEREEARRARDYAKADAVREEIRAKGISFNDDTRTWADRQGRAGRWGLKTPSSSSLLTCQSSSSEPMSTLSSSMQQSPFTMSLAQSSPGSLVGNDSFCSTGSKLHQSFASRVTDEDSGEDTNASTSDVNEVVDNVIRADTTKADIFTQPCQQKDFTWLSWECTQKAVENQYDGMLELNDNTDDDDTPMLLQADSDDDEDPDKEFDASLMDELMKCTSTLDTAEQDDNDEALPMVTRLLHRMGLDEPEPATATA